MFGLLFAEAAQVTPPTRLFATSTRQRLLARATSSPFGFGHLANSSHPQDDASLSLLYGVSPSAKPLVATTLATLATVFLLYIVLSRSAVPWPKWLNALLAGHSNYGTPRSTLDTPPVVHIPRDVQLSGAGHAAYNEALDKHGDVVIIPRHGRMEYVVDHRHVRDVLTDANNYSFEKAVTNMLHMEFMLWFKNGTFVQELDKLVQDGVTPRLRAVVEKISPVFEKESNDIWQRTADGKHVEIANMYEWVHHAIAQAMVVLILGEQYLTPKMTAHFMDVVVAIAHLSGIYENTQGWKYLPGLWSFKTTMTAIFGTVVPKFLFGVVPQIWKNRNVHLNHGVDVESNEYAPFFDLLAAKHRNKRTGKLSFLDFIWCSIICLGIIFASIHQTAVVAVWCVMNLSKRQGEYLAEIRAEIKENVQVDDDGQSSLSIESLRELTKLDSFIREVMRTKGDTFAPVRYTTNDVRVGKFVIPKNSLCAPYVKRTHEHADHYGPDGTTFRGFQWHEQGKPAVQGNNDFISFGIGRWGCPGRHLAIAEIKIILISLFAKYDVQLKDGDFSTPDPMNATSVAPEAVVVVSRRADE